jgi:hypothetical protein
MRGNHGRDASLVRIKAAGLALVLLSGCAKGTFRYEVPVREVRQAGNRVAVMPVILVLPVPRGAGVSADQAGRARSMYQSLLEDELAKRGFEVVPSTEVVAMREQLAGAFGAKIDHLGQVQGLDRVGLVGMRSSLLGYVRDRLKAPLVLFPALVETSVWSENDPRRCEGLVRRPGERSSGIQVPGLVLELDLLEPSGTGRQLWSSACLLGFLESDLVIVRTPLPLRPLLENSTMAERAVKFALSSLVVGR